MVKNLKAKFSEGGLKSVVLAVGGFFITGAAEAYRVGDIRTALALGVGAMVAFAIHEALSQYQFAWTEDLNEFIANTVPGVEMPPDDEGGE